MRRLKTTVMPQKTHAMIEILITYEKGISCVEGNEMKHEQKCKPILEKGCGKEKCS